MKGFAFKIKTSKAYDVIKDLFREEGREGKVFSVLYEVRITPKIFSLRMREEIVKKKGVRFLAALLGARIRRNALEAWEQQMSTIKERVLQEFKEQGLNEKDFEEVSL